MSKGYKAVIIALAACLLAFWIYDSYEARQALKQDIATLEVQKLRLQEDWDETKGELNRANKIIVNIKDRPPMEIYHVKNIPADCQTCFKKHKISISVKDENGLWIYKADDVFKPGVLTLTDKFEDEVIKPRDDALSDCMDKLKGRKLKFLNIEHEVVVALGLGVNAYEASVRYKPVTLGRSKFLIKPYAEFETNVDAFNMITFQAFVGLEVTIP